MTAAAIVGTVRTHSAATTTPAAEETTMRFTTLEQIRDAANASNGATPKADLDLTSLPVFGGEEPSALALREAGYQAAWSWDAERVLVTDRNGVFTIVDRSELI